jgi:Ser/Thr protein kinase RdoA (MazF antagonist)
MEAYCVIDLDTLMPGYFIYDLGDLVRTVVSPVSEEEKDFSKIMFRKSLYDAIIGGYLSEIELTEKEKIAIPFAGLMMTYIMALRFLADFLNNNIYYHITYPEENLVRAGNQLRLLTILRKEI